MRNIIYKSAGAGSGKTYYLTHVLSDLIKDGKVKPQEVILTTFTKKAAKDFKEKSKDVLYENGLFEAASLLDNALIGTIHSVAMNLIGKYWFFLGLSPALDTIAEEDAALYQSQSLSTLATKEEIYFLKNFVRKMDIRETYGYGSKGVKYDYNFWKEPLKNIIAISTNHSVTSYNKSREASKDFFRNLISRNAPAKLPVGKELRDFIRDLKILPLALNSATRRGQLNELEEGWKSPNFPYYLTFEKFASGLPKSTQENFSETVNKAKRLGMVWQTQMVYDMMEKFIDLMFDMAKRWKVEYDRYKRENNLLDFNDQEKYFLELLNLPQCAQEISKEFKCVFVDEFQDCSPIQVKIFSRLSELVEQSYWVGDNKQAIYGFRASDTQLTETVVNILDKDKKNHNKVETLETSYRSVEEIVKCCNSMFVRVFPEIPEKRVVLNPHRESNKNGKPLVVWSDATLETVAKGISEMIEKGEKPKDIAILARNKYPLDELASILESRGIPGNRESLNVNESRLLPLISAVLEIVDNDSNHLAKATVGFLTEKNYDTEKIIENILSSIDDEGKRHMEFLDKIPLVMKIKDVVKKHRHQSVGKLVETVLIETGIYEEAKKLVDGNEAERVIDTILTKAKDYEESSLRLGFVPTLSGFVSSLQEENMGVPGNPEGVNLVTIHSSKGLEWKTVILLDLFEDPTDVRDFIKKDIFGVHFHKTETPSEKNLFPEVYITLLPYVYGPGFTKVPEFISSYVFGNASFRDSMKEKVYEESRLLYVAFTRASDTLVLVEMTKKDKPFRWLEVTHLDNADSVEKLKDNYGFKEESILSEDIEEELTIADKAEEDTFAHPGLKKHERRDHSPSGEEGIKKIKNHYCFDSRISIGSLPAGKDEADLGTCIHHIFHMFEYNAPSNEIMEKVISEHGFENSFPQPEQIKVSWDNLLKRIESLHGRILRHHHEVPFRMQDEGKVFTGSIDMTVETDNGLVLIDFKSCPMGGKILEEGNAHFAGIYGGQLSCYSKALSASGKKPIASYLYYPVSGYLVELDL